MNFIGIFSNLFSFWGLIFFLAGSIIGYCYLSGRIKRESIEIGDSISITWLKVVCVSLGSGFIIAFVYELSGN